MLEKGRCMKEKILIVDDEKEIADLIEVYLKNDGYEVYKFYNGSDALNCIAENDVDMAVLDVMPVSYTHLMQNLITGDIVSLSALYQNSISSRRTGIPAPVSYTHLDVYKRQVYVPIIL